jgi:hypothetical protein
MGLAEWATFYTRRRRKLNKKLLTFNGTWKIIILSTRALRPYVILGLRNMVYCYGEKLLDLLNLQAEWHPLSAIREFLYNTLVNINC